MTNYEGYMCEANFDGYNLHMRGTNKAMHFALMGAGAPEFIALVPVQISSVTVKAPTMLVNGSMAITTTDGKKYELAFRKKHAEAFAQLHQSVLESLPERLANERANDMPINDKPVDDDDDDDDDEPWEACLASLDVPGLKLAKKEITMHKRGVALQKREAAAEYRETRTGMSAQLLKNSRGGRYVRQAQQAGNSKTIAEFDRILGVYTERILLIDREILSRSQS